MRRWHKAQNVLRDARYTTLNPATKSVYRDLCEMLSDGEGISGNISTLANWLSTDRRTMRVALEDIQASGLLAVTSEERGKLGTFYAIEDPTVSTRSAQGQHEVGSTSAQGPLKVAPDKSPNDAVFQDSSLYRVEKKREEEKRIYFSPSPLKGDVREEKPIEVPFSESPEQPGDEEAVTVEETPPPRSAAPPSPVRRLSPAPKPKRYLHRFEEFKAKYPRREAWSAAEQAWDKLKPDDALVDVILKAVDDWLPEWAMREPKFIPLPASWLNGKRWTDAPPVVDIQSARSNRSYGGDYIAEAAARAAAELKAMGFQ